MKMTNKENKQNRKERTKQRKAFKKSLWYVFSEEEKDKKSKYAREWYRNFSEEKKRKSVTMVLKNVKILQRISLEKIFLKCKK